MPFFRYRPLNTYDYARCKDMLLNVFGIHEFKGFVSSWRQRSDTSLVVTYKDSLLGYILVDTDHKIQYLCVDPEFRNARLGSSLLTRVLDSLRNIESVRLTTAKDSRLTGWYARFGFIVEKVHTKNGEFAGADMVLNNICE